MYDDEQTMAKEAIEFDKLIAEAGLTGLYEGDKTAAQKAMEAQLTGMYDDEATLQKALAEAELTGMYDDEATLRKALAEAELTGTYGDDDTFQKTLAEAGLTGMYGEDPTMAKEAMEFDKNIAAAGLTGTYEEAPTMAREALDQTTRQQLISQILAAGQKDLEGRLDPLATHLAGEFSGDDFDLNMALWQSLNPGMAQASYNPPQGII